MIVTSFVDLQKISIFPKFGGCGSKNEPATPISISNFSRAWQSFNVSYALQILANDRFLQVIKSNLHQFLVSVTGKLKFQKTVFSSIEYPPYGKKGHVYGLYHTMFFEVLQMMILSFLEIFISIKFWRNVPKLSIQVWKSAMYFLVF